MRIIIQLIPQTRIIETIRTKKITVQTRERTKQKEGITEEKCGIGKN